MCGCHCSRRSLRPPTASSLKNSEQRELEAIEAKRQEAARLRQMAEESRQMALRQPVAAQIQKKVTHVEEFHFATDSRLKSNTDASKTEEESAANFVRQLRKHSAVVSLQFVLSQASSLVTIIQGHQFHGHFLPGSTGS